MRYDDWDVILFPKDSHVPIQEFKTACYHNQDSTEAQQPPTLTCYISSLPPKTAFRISVHSWATTAKPSVMIESQRRANQKIMYKVQVVVDGAKVFRNCFDTSSRWPQEIAHEKRTTTSADHPTSQRVPILEFPPFSQHTLMQTVWDPRDTSGRINIVLSEQLVGRSSGPAELDLGIVNEIVCFSFQHAPKDVLEQAGISWPIRNPLYLPDICEGTLKSPDSTESSSRPTKAQETRQGNHAHSPTFYDSASTFPRFHNHEPLQRPRTQPPPQSHFPRPSLGTRGHGRGDIWDNSLGSFRDNNDEVSLDSWSTQRTASNSTGDTFKGDCMFAPSQPSRPPPMWRNPPPRQQHAARSGWADQRPRKDQDREVVLKLRDDQLGQIIQAISPPKRHRDLSHSTEIRHESYSARPSAPHAYYPPKMGSLPMTGPPSAATLARKSSYPNLAAVSRNASSRPSPDKQKASEHTRTQATSMYHPSASSNKENFPPSQSRLSAAYPLANREPTFNPFAPILAHCDSDVAMKDPSSIFSGYNRYNGGDSSLLSETHMKHGTAHIPTSLGGVRSRKEGLAHHSPHLSEREVRHDQSLLPRHGSRQTMQKPPASEPPNAMQSTPSMISKAAPEIVEIIDVDAIDPGLDTETSLDATKLSPCQPQHKPGTSSIDSTIQIERKLMNAFDDEYGTCESLPDMGPGLAQSLSGPAPTRVAGLSPMLNPNANEFEPAGKRKRQEMLGGEGSGSPMSKRETGSQGVVQEGLEDVDHTNMPSLRGD